MLLDALKWLVAQMDLILRTMDAIKIIGSASLLDLEILIIISSSVVGWLTMKNGGE